MTVADVAVIVPVAQRDVDPRDSLDVVARQTVMPRRVVVVDNRHLALCGGPTLVDLPSSVAAGVQVELVRQPNRGLPAARNQGLGRLADERYVAFLDPGADWSAGFLERAVARLSAHPSAVAATADVDPGQPAVGRGQATLLGLHPSSPAAPSHEEQSLANIETHAAAWLFTSETNVVSASLFDRSALRRLSNFREDMPVAAELDLLLRLSLTGRWLHVAGPPSSLSAAAGDWLRPSGMPGPPLDDPLRRGARVYDDFIERYNGRDVLVREQYAGPLAARWLAAGRELLQAGRSEEARDCLRRSAHWKLANKAWLVLAQSFFRRAA